MCMEVEVRERVHVCCVVWVNGVLLCVEMCGGHSVHDGLLGELLSCLVGVGCLWPNLGGVCGA